MSSDMLVSDLGDAFLDVTSQLAKKHLRQIEIRRKNVCSRYGRLIKRYPDKAPDLRWQLEEEKDLLDQEAAIDFPLLGTRQLCDELLISREELDQRLLECVFFTDMSQYDYRKLIRDLERERKHQDRYRRDILLKVNYFRLCILDVPSHVRLGLHDDSIRIKKETIRRMNFASTISPSSI